MSIIAMIVTNACDPDPRVEKSAKWLVEEGHEVTIYAFDRSQLGEVKTDKNGFTIIRYQLGDIPYGGTVKTVFGLRKFHRKLISDLIIVERGIPIAFSINFVFVESSKNSEGSNESF